METLLATILFAWIALWKLVVPANRKPDYYLERE
jgi:hypothetical protein